MNAVRNLQNEYPGGNTNTQAAIQTARTQLFVSGSDRSDAQNILIVITDGVPTIRPENTIPEADTTKRNNIDIYAVGITRFIDEDTLKQMSSSPQERDRNYFTSPDFNQLDDILDNLIGQACVTPSPSTPPPPTPPPTCANAKLDIVFAVDGSGSICDNDPTFQNGRCNNWNNMVTFIENIVNFLGVGRDASRVGLLTFANEADVKWTLDR